MRLVSNHRHHGDPQNDFVKCPTCEMDIHFDDLDPSQYDELLGDVVCAHCFRDYERREARDNQAKTD
jgi:hypothetical protein